jgi:type II secretory pathway pseudopilin PulG
MENKQRGFTLIELNLAMVFVSMLLIATIATSIFAGKLYQKGIALKTVNQTSRQLIDQMRRDIMASDSEPKFAKNSNSFRLCMPTVAYVFSTASTFNDGKNVKYQSSSKPVYAARVTSTNAANFCNPPYNSPSEASSKELLPQDSIPIAVHDMAFSHQAMGGGDSEYKMTQRIYSMSLTIGTNEKNTVETNNTCKPPTNNQANFDLCSVREFTTLIRTIGGS